MKLKKGSYGKKSDFYIESYDKRLIIKSISLDEYNLLQENAINYLNHIQEH